MDFCFRTYALDQPPNVPIVDGPRSGFIGHVYDYRLNATDPEGHYISYYVDWGDGSNTGWFGPFHSGTEASISHSWDAEQTYSMKVKVKDQFDAESDWTTIEVMIPKNKIVSVIYCFLQSHPNIFPILRYLFGF
jgi:hypothetical protein